MDPNILDWMNALRSPVDSKVATYYLEKTRQRWRAGRCHHVNHDGYVIPYNLTSVTIHWLASESNVRKPS